MSGHTTGPWEVVRSLSCGHLRAAHNFQVDPKNEWTDADLKLIAAAPELLAACEMALKRYESEQLFGPDRNELLAAIKKAKGE
jgi:hypothetical protein